jgi:hypothetical protein
MNHPVARQFSEKITAPSLIRVTVIARAAQIDAPIVKKRGGAVKGGLSLRYSST